MPNKRGGQQKSRKNANGDPRLIGTQEYLLIDVDRNPDLLSEGMVFVVRNVANN